MHWGHYSYKRKDVFREELPRVPRQREIDFEIELVPSA